MSEFECRTGEICDCGHPSGTNAECKRCRLIALLWEKNGKIADLRWALNALLQDACVRGRVWDHYVVDGRLECSLTKNAIDAALLALDGKKVRDEE